MRAFVPVLIVMVLTACGSGGNVRQTLGLNKSAPDEFKVVSRPPLSVPPEFFLEPPRPGEPPRETQRAEDRAESLLLQDSDLELDLSGELGSELGSLDGFEMSSVPTATDPVLTSSVGSVGESRFLERIGADDADDEIRLKLIQDRQSTSEEEDTTQNAVQRWLGLDATDDSVVNPQGEAERIREKMDKEETISGEDAVIDDPKERSVIDQIFN
tara:strand:+ start:341 stop:982 length:642 start_codon:yes stop_codon:yes gene_type:complete